MRVRRGAAVSQLSYIADSVVIKGLALEMSGTATRRMAVGCHRAVLQTASLAQAAPNGQQPAWDGQQMPVTGVY